MYTHGCLYLHHMHARYLRRQEDGIRSSESGVKDGRGPPCEFWELNTGPMEEQPMNS